MVSCGERERERERERESERERREDAPVREERAKPEAECAEQQHPPPGGGPPVQRPALRLHRLSSPALRILDKVRAQVAGAQLQTAATKIQVLCAWILAKCATRFGESRRAGDRRKRRRRYPSAGSLPALGCGAEAGGLKLCYGARGHFVVFLSFPLLKGFFNFFRSIFTRHFISVHRSFICRI
jgi:hypothetical protein